MSIDQRFQLVILCLSKTPIVTARQNDRLPFRFGLEKSKWHPLDCRTIKLHTGFGETIIHNGQLTMIL
jgi:hypothetical protein